MVRPKMISSSSSPRRFIMNGAKFGTTSRHRTLIFTSLWVALFPFAWFTMQWNNYDQVGFIQSVEGEPLETRRVDLQEQRGEVTTAAVVNSSGTTTTQIPSSQGRLILDPNDHPIIAELGMNTSTKPFPVAFIGKKGSIYYSALEQSRSIQVCSHQTWTGDERITEPPPLWMTPTEKQCQPQLLIVDWSSLDRDCHYLSPDTVPETLPILFLDASASTKVVECQEIRHGITAKRSIVENRWWHFDDQHIHPGTIIRTPHSSVVYQMPGCVVSTTDKPQPTAEVDVLHYWNSHNDILSRQYSSWRTAVSYQLQATQRSLQQKQTSLWLTSFGLNDDNVTDDTITKNELASAKMIVVTQSDEYEDHDNRLMEALASGALVLADAMVAAPIGLTNGTNIVFFDNRKTLDRLVRYYLKHASKRHAIGNAGREFALKHHQCWQVMEKLLFGRSM